MCKLVFIITEYYFSRVPTLFWSHEWQQWWWNLNIWGVLYFLTDARMDTPDKNVIKLVIIELQVDTSATV